MRKISLTRVLFFHGPECTLEIESLLKVQIIAYGIIELRNPNEPYSSPSLIVFFQIAVDVSYLFPAIQCITTNGMSKEQDM